MRNAADDDVVLAAGARTAIGRLGGSLSGVSAVDLGASAVRATLERSGGLVPDRAIMGCVLQAGLGQHPARQAALRGGAPAVTPGITVNDVCLSGMSAAVLGALLVRAGEAGVVIVGGFESMSRAPHVTRIRGVEPDAATAVDTMIRDGLWCAFEDVGMGPQAEATTHAMGIGRADQDAFAAASHQRAAAAWRAGRFAVEVTPVITGDRIVDTDEGIRPDSTVETLAGLRPAFAHAGTITAGNSSQISDAGAAGIITTRRHAVAAGLEPLAAIVDHALVAGPDHSLHTKPSRAARLLLERHGMRPRDVDRWEINEAFAAVALASMTDLDIDHDRVNVNGGAIALGHPLGASGFRLLLTLALEMRRSGAATGVAAICGGGGQGQAVLLRRPG